jgi:succinoglycan biosynthesis transport protein ExoP
MKLQRRYTSRPLNQYHPDQDPIEVFEPGSQLVGSTPSIQLDWAQIKTALLRNWLLLIGVVVTLTLVVALPLFLIIKPTYEPVARVVIDPPGTETFSLEAAIPSSEAADYLQTQVAILKSDALAIEVIRQLHLDHNAELVGRKALEDAAGNNAVGSGTKLTHLENLALKTFQTKLNVSLFRNSRLVEVSYASHDSELATQVTNNLVNLFVDQNFQTRYSAIAKSSEWLTRQMDDIRQKVEQSNQALADYESKIGFLDVDEKQNDVLAEKLTDLNHQLTEAQAERIQLGAYVDAIRQGDIDSVPELRNNELFHQVTENYLSERARLAEELAVYGKNNPRIKRIESEVQQLRSGLVHGVEASYQSAKARETRMAQALAQMKTSINGQNEARVRLNLLKHEAIANAELYNTLFMKVREAGIATASKSSNVRVVDYARVLELPTRPNRPLYLSLSFLLALICGVMLAFIREAFDDTVRTEKDVLASTGLLCLGIVPRTASGTAQKYRFANPESKTLESETVRNLRTSILLAKSGKPPRVLLVSSPSAREGKTTVAINLATTLAKRARTCLIDADMRKPAIAELCGLPSAPGLSELLAGTSDLDSIMNNSCLDNLCIVPAGEGTIDPGELLCSPKLESALEGLRSKFEYLVIDSAPILPFSDARILSRLVDGVVLVSRHGTTQQPNLSLAAGALQELDARVLGVVINGVDRLPAYYHDYSLDPTEERPKWRRTVVWSIILAIAILAIPITRVIASRHKEQSSGEGQKQSSVSVPPSVQAATNSQQTGSTSLIASSSLRSAKELIPRTTRSRPTPDWIIVVQANQTLYSISRQYFNCANGEIIRKIRALNPQITDPNNISVGQSLSLPTDLEDAKGGINSADPSNRARRR